MQKLMYHPVQALLFLIALCLSTTSAEFIRSNIVTDENKNIPFTGTTIMKLVDPNAPPKHAQDQLASSNTLIYYG